MLTVKQAFMYPRPEIAISTRQGRPLAVVEVKNLPDLSLADATELRDTVVRPLGRPVKYVLVVSQNRGFIWERQGDQPPYGEPEVLDMQPVLREYLSQDELTRRFRGADLDLVLSHWLGNLARGRDTRPAGIGDHGPFVHFLADIRGAQINLEALS